MIRFLPEIKIRIFPRLKLRYECLEINKTSISMMLDMEQIKVRGWHAGHLIVITAKQCLV
ncbi:hypothetical protein FRX31_019566 [Thalictrum thalictroides]|uniref:Uncharacterized protein n=1 Tax=Thalictrum thalictroides TaxID=46969 RepID=A0A7J6W0D0_THATH|nr:hypothetical protein FRX31_019566 [Thalictrum thalictroides]